MSTLPIEPTERDRERFRDLTKAMQFGLEYDRHGDDYKYDLTDLMFRLWWSVERERQLLQNLNQSQGVKISELLARAEKAEAELAKLRTAPNEIGLGQGEFVIWPVQINGVHGLAFVKTDDPKAVGTSHAEPEDGQIEIGAGDSAIYFGNAESAMVLAERLQYVISLMAGSDAAPVPAVADKRVDELAMLIRRLVRRLNQELPHNDIGEAAMDYLARNGISGEILRGWAAPAVPEEWRKVMAELADDLAIEIDQSYPPERRAYPSEQRKYEGEMAPVYRARTLLQSATQSGSDPVAHHPV